MVVHGRTHRTLDVAITGLVNRDVGSMSRWSVSGSQKILLASALVVVGYGVARFLGQPVLIKGESSPVPQVQNSPPIREAPAPPLRSNVVGSARLLPEPVSKQTALAASSFGAAPVATMLGTRLESIMPVNSAIDAA